MTTTSGAMHRIWAPDMAPYPVRRTGYGTISGATHRIKPISGASRCQHPVHPPDVACIIRCVAPDVACIIRCTAPDLACIIRCISVPTSGALHRMWHVLSGALHRIWHALSGASRCPHPVHCTIAFVPRTIACPGMGTLLDFHVEELVAAAELYQQQLERERCQVGPKDASWPMHSGGNTARTG